jgi:hypothetical protein
LESCKDNGENGIYGILSQLLDVDKGKSECILPMSGKDITAVRVLTLVNVGVPVDGAGIGSTRAGKFRRNIMYTETRDS